MKIDLLEDVAPASNELGAVADMANQMLELQNEINRLEESLKTSSQALSHLLARLIVPKVTTRSQWRYANNNALIGYETMVLVI